MQTATDHPKSARRRKPRAVPLLYPELPEVPHLSGGTVTNADFDRAAFLRAIAELGAGKALVDAWWPRIAANSPALFFLAGAQIKAKDDAAKNFTAWMEDIGGLASYEVPA